MVSKIAVMAVVAVVAVPILLGYGLNIQSDTYTAYEKDKASLDVTEYLYNVTDTSKRDYTAADLYLFNSTSFYQSDVNILPWYQSITSNKTSIQTRQVHYDSMGSTFTPGNPLEYYYSDVIVYGGYDASNYYSAVVTHSDNTTETYDHLMLFKWLPQDTTANVDIEYYYSVNSIGQVSMDDAIAFSIVPHGTPPGIDFHRSRTTYNEYADISKGYILNQDYPVSSSSASPNSSTYIQPDGICKNMLLTFNLDSITASDYWLGFFLGGSTYRYHIQIIKETVDGTAKWYYQIYGDDERHELYYDPAISSNAYQLYLDSKGGEFRYVGTWTDSIGVMQPFISYPFTFDEGDYYWYIPDALPSIRVIGQTPIMRIDASMVAAYEYRVIRDVTYTPANFKTNPTTTLTNMLEYGSSIQFGGITYNVTSGNITMGTKQVSLRNMVLESIPNGDGQYDNMINGVIVSTTPAPSAITLNGDWRITITTDSQSSVTKSVTKWEPGKFAWNGIDTDFKIAGLMASLGAFIALAVYGRRSGTKVMPLLVVCGGAALMFLVMI